MSNVDTDDQRVRCVIEEDCHISFLPSIAELGIVNLVAEDEYELETVVVALDRQAVEELRDRLEALLAEGKLRDWEDNG